MRLDSCTERRFCTDAEVELLTVVVSVSQISHIVWLTTVPSLFAYALIEDNSYCIKVHSNKRCKSC